MQSLSIHYIRTITKMFTVSKVHTKVKGYSIYKSGFVRYFSKNMDLYLGGIINGRVWSQSFFVNSPHRAQSQHMKKYHIRKCNLIQGHFHVISTLKPTVCFDVPPLTGNMQLNTWAFPRNEHVETCRNV